MLVEQSEEDEVLRTLLAVKKMKKQVLESKTMVFQRRCAAAQAELHALFKTFQYNRQVRLELEQDILSSITGHRIGLVEVTQANQKIGDLKAQNSSEKMAIQAQKDRLSTLLSEKKRWDQAMNRLEREEEKIQTLLSEEESYASSVQ